MPWQTAFLAMLFDLARSGWKKRHLHGGLKCIGRLEAQRIVDYGLFLLCHVWNCIRKMLVLLQAMKVTTVCAAGKRQTKSHPFPPLPPLPWAHQHGNHDEYNDWRRQDERQYGASSQPFPAL